MERLDGKVAVVTGVGRRQGHVAAERIRVNAISPGTVATPVGPNNERMFTLFRPDLKNPTSQDCEAVNH